MIGVVVWAGIRWNDMNKKLYCYELNDRINDQLPQCIKDAMDNSGWNALGIWEMVDEEIKKGKVQSLTPTKDNQEE